MTRPLVRRRVPSTLKNRRLPPHARTRRLITELQVINEIVRAISSQWHGSAVLETIITQTSRLMDTRNCYIALHDRKTRTIQFPVALEAGKRMIWPPRGWSNGITEWILQHQQPSWGNVDDHPPDIVPIRVGQPTKSYLGVPILLGNESLGVISVQSYERQNAFSERDRLILMMIADQAGIALANALRYEAVDHELKQRIEELEALEATARDLNATLDLNTVLQRLNQRVCAITRAHAGMVCLMAEDGTEVRLATASGYPAAINIYIDQGWPISRGITGKVVRTGEPSYVPDVRRSAEYINSRPDSMSQLTVPIKYADKVLGVLVLESDELDAFTAHHLGFVMQIANHAALSIRNARTHQQVVAQQALLSQRTQQLSEVLRVSQALSAHLKLEPLLHEIVAAIRTSLGFNSALLSLLDPGPPPMMRRKASVGIPPEEWRHLRCTPVALTWYLSVMCDKFQISRSYFVPHDHAEYDQIWNTPDPSQYRPDLGERGPNEWHPDDALFVPLHDSEGELLGIISVDDPHDRRVPGLAAVQVLEIFATQAAIAIENAHLYAKTEHLAITDGLTGLYNQHHFQTLITTELQRAQRYNQPLSLLAFDLDRFKQYNDAYGHLEGNIVLREFAQLLQANIRDADIIARNGGEEFAVILPQTNAMGAYQLAERLRHLVEHHPFPNRHMTVSIGVATFHRNMESIQLQHAADQALYAAKAAGRNTTVLHDGLLLALPSQTEA